jgi:DUF1680 family protein
MKRSILFFMLMTAVSLYDYGQQTEQLLAGQWSVEKANDWYAKHSWIVGCNFVPSTAVNDVEMWQDETFDLETMDKELGLARAWGINSVRVFLNYVVWEAETEKFKSNFRKFLDLAEKHGISVMPVLFDDCNFSNTTAKVGKQSGAGRDFCLCDWVSSPPRAMIRDKSQWQKLKEYEQDMIRTFGSDRRIIIWDLYSEPGNSSSGLNAELLENIFAWAREMNPSQPLTVGVWNQFDEFTRRSSDIVSFHRYTDKSDFEQKIKWAKETGRPAICTEWLHRPDENTLAEIWPVLKETKTGGYFWGPVNGKTQTYAQCGSTPQKPAVQSHTGGAADLELLAGNGLGNVDVAAPYLVNAARMEIPYLLEFDMDRMLYRFREQAGLDTRGASPYNAGGESWYAGHFTGHYLSAVSQACAGTTATVRQKAQLSQRLTAIVDGVREAQLAYAAKNPANAGFLPAFAVTSVPNGEAPGGAPFYSLHKELQGLVNVYQYSPDQATRDKALAAAGDFARWVVNWRAAHPAADILRVEYGGINEGLYNLFEITGNPIHAQAAHLFDEETVFQRLANGEDPLPEPDPHYGACGHHANAIVPTLIGAARRYTLYMSRPEYYAMLPAAEKLKLETLYRPAAENFFDIVVEHHTYANGGHAQGEFFHEPDQLWYDATQRNGVHGRDASSTSETCGTYNMLKLARLLFQATGDVKYSEYYERAFVNQMVGSQHPKTATTTYFQPMAAGFAKLFFGLPKPVFFCCEGSSLETFTKLNGSLYFTDGENLWVNMFIASTFRDTRHKLVLTATGDVPKQDAMTYTVTAMDGETIPAGVRLKLRLPQWAQTDAVRLVVDGVSVPVSPVDGWLTVPVRNGTKIVYTLAPKLWMMPAQDNPNWVAFFYGPVLLAAQLNQNNIGAIRDVNLSIIDTAAAAKGVVYPASGSPAQWIADVKENLVRIDDRANTTQFPTFRTANTAGEPLTLVPFYSVYEWRYAAYLEIADVVGGEQY